MIITVAGVNIIAFVGFITSSLSNYNLNCYMGLLQSIISCPEQNSKIRKL